MHRARKRKPKVQAQRRARPGLAPEELAPTVVGIGASAGGLEAIEQFLKGVPTRSGLAFVIVQHLDPTHQGLMAELLQRGTGMRVAQVEDPTRVEPDNVYVIPPNKDLSILRGTLHLLDPSSPRGLRLPIDFFLRALADDQRAASVAVILSGMGNDGTLGVKAVKDRGGLVLVQDPTTAKYDSMPRGAIETGLADVVAPVEELPARLIALLQSATQAASIKRPIDPQAKGALDKIVMLLRSRLGRDFSQYKKSTLERRIARRMTLHQIARADAYVRYLQENPQEQELLTAEFLVGVTSFFRDPAAWDALRDRVIPELLAERVGGGPLRAWMPGCSTGEEAYTLAMIFREVVDKARPKAGASIQIFATDLDRRAIETARRAVYPAAIASDVSPQRLRRFFVSEHGGTHRVSSDLRESVILAEQDVTRDPPFTRMDIVVCRNLFIYLEPELQQRLIPLFHYSLRSGGVLFLGTSESISGMTALFRAVEPKLRIYRRKEAPTQLDSLGGRSFFAPALPAAAPDPGTARPQVSLQAAADEVLLRQFGPPAALVKERGDIIYLNGRVGEYLELAAGRANWNVLVMAREWLRHPMASALQKASRQQRAVTVRGLTAGTDEEARRVDLMVKPLHEPEALRGAYLLVFQEAAAAPSPRRGGKLARRVPHPARLAELESEVRQLHHELRNTREDMQTSQEELKSTNEELQSTNEELQSTNEELTTSKEEMQSMNEELQTVNAELQAKVDELSRTSSDMRNLLNSTEIATLFLDHSLRIRRYTEQATRFLRLIPADVGRPITDVASDLVFPALPETVAQVLQTLLPVQREIVTADGRWYSTRVMPYRTLHDVIDGVVITAMDVTAAKQLEAELRTGRERFRTLLENLPEGLAVVDGQGRHLSPASMLKAIVDERSEMLADWRIVRIAEVAPE